MSVSNSLDAVQAVIDILDNTTDSDYTATKPTFIERQEETDQSTKAARAGQNQYVAVYVYAPADGDYEQHGFDYGSYHDTQRVTVDPWHPASASGVRQLHRDLREIFFDYVNDNEATTRWQRIRPVTPVPLAQETLSGGGHFRYPLELELHANREPL